MGREGAEKGAEGGGVTGKVWTFTQNSRRRGGERRRRSHLC